MICPKCNIVNKSNAKFCGNCGYKLKKSKKIFLTLGIITAVIIVGFGLWWYYYNFIREVNYSSQEQDFGELYIVGDGVITNSTDPEKYIGNSRNIEQVVYELQGHDGVYWTTQGSSTKLHLYKDCSEFHGMSVVSGDVFGAVEYFGNKKCSKYNSYYADNSYHAYYIYNFVICDVCQKRIQKKN